MRNKALICFLAVSAVALWSGLIGFMNYKAPNSANQTVFLAIWWAAVTATAIPIAYDRDSHRLRAQRAPGDTSRREERLYTSSVARAFTRHSSCLAHGPPIPPRTHFGRRPDPDNHGGAHRDPHIFENEIKDALGIGHRKQRKREGMKFFIPSRHALDQCDSIGRRPLYRGQRYESCPCQRAIRYPGQRVPSCAGPHGRYSFYRQT